MVCNSSPYVPEHDLLGVPQGSDFNVEIIYQEGEPPVTVDLSGYSAKLQVRRTFDTPVILQLSTDDGTIVMNSTAPNIVLKFPNDVTSRMTVYSDLIYDLEMTSPTGLKSRVMQGKFSISREVTQ